MPSSDLPKVHIKSPFKHFKILIFKVIFQWWKWVKPDFFFLKDYYDRRPTFDNDFFWNLFLKALIFLNPLFSKNVPKFCLIWIILTGMTMTWDAVKIMITIKSWVSFWSTCRLFQIAYKWDFFILIYVTFWQKVGFLISNAR